VHLRERQGDLTVGGLRRRPYRRGAAGIAALEPGPAQRALGVLVVEKIDQPSRLDGTVEVLLQAPGQFGGQSRVCLAGRQSGRVALRSRL